MTIEKIWVVELNLNGNVNESVSYHIDTLESTIEQNLETAFYKKKVDHWVIIGVVNSIEKAQKYAEEFRKKICIRFNLEPKNLPLD